MAIEVVERPLHYLDKAVITGLLNEITGRGPTIGADAVRKLFDSVINFHEKSRTIVSEMRELSTKNPAEIRDAVEDGKRRLAQLAADGYALLLETKQA